MRVAKAPTQVPNGDSVNSVLAREIVEGSWRVSHAREDKHMSRRVEGRVDVHVVTPDRWGDVVDLFERPGPRGGTPQTNGCWCQFWHLRGKAYWAGHGARNRMGFE